MFNVFTGGVALGDMSGSNIDREGDRVHFSKEKSKNLYWCWKACLTAEGYGNRGVKV